MGARVKSVGFATRLPESKPWLCHFLFVGPKTSRLISLRLKFLHLWKEK